MSKDELTAQAQDVARNVATAQGTVEIVGMWLWVTFPNKPPAEVRGYLHSLKAFWNKRRGCWQISNGYKTGPSKADSWYLKGQYGAEIVEVEEATKL